ncbi:MAG: hypothetical protein CSA44_02270 [Gammaproteobacteria bacterium]|nr:MAG: hypothetical protein CSA44_02270 [Gammaproteobacteria bacterium]
MMKVSSFPAGQLVPRLLLRLLPRLLPPLVSLLLLLGLAYQGARLVWQFFTPETIVTITEAETPPDDDLLATWQLSTTLSSQTAAGQPAQRQNKQNRQNWQVKGIYLEDNNQSVAIIQTGKDKSHVVEVGDHIDQEITVVMITAQSVVLDVNGNETELTLQDNTMADISNNTLGFSLAAPPAETTPTATTPAAATAKTAVNRASQAIQDFPRFIQLMPLTEKGKTVYQLQTSQPQGIHLLNQLGLQVNDVLLAVDGVPSADINPLQLLENLKKQQKISAKIRRNGTIQTVTIK